MGFGPGIRGCASCEPAVAGAEPDFREFYCCVGVGEGRRTTIFILWFCAEPTMKVLNTMLWLVQFPNHYYHIQKSKKDKSIYSNLLLSYTSTITSPASITKLCKHTSSSLHSKAKQPPTHQPSPSLILHISTIEKWPLANSPLGSSQPCGLDSTSTAAMVITCTFPMSKCRNCSVGICMICGCRVSDVLMTTICSSADYISGEAQRLGNTSNAAGPSRARAPSRAPSQTPFLAHTQPMNRK